MKAIAVTPGKAGSTSCTRKRADGQLELLRAFAHLNDRAVESDRSRALGQPAFFLELVDLRVALDQGRRRTRLPGQDRLLPDRRVARLTGLGAEDGELSCGRLALNKVDLRRRFQRHRLED